MSLYVSGFASSGTTRNQGIAAGGGTQTNLNVTERARLITSGAGTATATNAATSNATWQLRLNGNSIGTVTINSGNTSGGVSLTGEVILRNGDQLQAIAPGGSPFPGGTTVNLAWLFRLSAWAFLPNEPNRLFRSTVSAWNPVLFLYVAQEDPLDIPNLKWSDDPVWQGPPPPAGVSVSLTQELLLGGDVIASWTNPAGSTGLSYEVQWEINSSLWGVTSGAAGPPSTSQESNLPAAELSNGDSVRARMRYLSGSVPGDWGSFSSALGYVA